MSAPRLLALFLLAFGCAFLLWSVAPESGYPDAWYYRAAAREIAEGRGLTIPYLWSYVATGGGIDPAGVIPLPAFDHWAPLASFIPLPSLLLLGTTPLGYSLPFLIVAALLAPLTAALAIRLGASPRLALLAGLFAAIPGPFFWWITRSDNFALFALLGNLALWCLADARIGRRRRLTLVLAGACLGLAALSRTDGLILVPLLLWAAWPTEPGISLLSRLRRYAVGLLCGGFGGLLVFSPWLLRQLLTFGLPFPSAASGRILWIRDYRELWGADGPLGLANLLDQEPLRLIVSRLDAAVYVLVVAGLYLAGSLCLPFLVRGLRELWRAGHPHVRLIGMAFVTHLAWSVFVAAPHVKNGNYIHGLMLYLPLAIIGTLRGAELLSERIVARGLGPLSGPSIRAGRAVLPIVAATWIAMSLLLSLGFLLPDALRKDRLGNSIAAAIADLELPAETRLAGMDPGMLTTLTGHPAILLPRSSNAVIDRALAAYQVRLVVIESRDDWGQAWVKARAADLDPVATVAAPAGGEVTLYLLP